MTQLHAQDEILYCTRCGISFLWSQEEQRAVGDQAVGDQAPSERPQWCPGCRRLAPKAGRERGIVKWYNQRKHFGFIVRASHPDVYVHQSALAGGRALQPGDLVEFQIESSERGLAAGAVVLVEPAPA